MTDTDRSESAPEMPQSSEPTSLARRRTWLFRLSAILVGLSPLVIAECTLTLLGLGGPDDTSDPFVGFSAVQPLFVLDETGSRYEIARGRQDFFRPDSFAAEKPPDEFRIFCLGGSTVQGRPYAIETSFTTWLELSLRAADPGRRWEVVNCGGISYASYRLLPILEEVLDYSPDLVIVYTGQNEFLEDRTYAHIKHLPWYLSGPRDVISGLRTTRCLVSAYRSLRGTREPAEARPILPEEVDALLDHRGGLELYHRDETWRRDVIDHYRYNLRRMAALTRQRHVPLILVNPVSNLKDCPPFKSQHRDGITPEEEARWTALREAARKTYTVDRARAVALLEEALEIDDEYAGVHFQLAEYLDGQGRMERARETYLRAKELDVCPLRILEPMNRIVLEVAQEMGTPVVDVKKLFEERSANGIPGSEWLLDHVHPSIRGHQFIASALLDRMIAEGFVHARAGWEAERKRVYREHLESLDHLYFAQGKRRLENLRVWARGRAGTELLEKTPGTDGEE